MGGVEAESMIFLHLRVELPGRAKRMWNQRRFLLMMLFALLFMMKICQHVNGYNHVEGIQDKD